MDAFLEFEERDATEAAPHAVVAGVLAGSRPAAGLQHTTSTWVHMIGCEDGILAASPDPKVDEFGSFAFGGSDIINLHQTGTWLAMATPPST